MLRRWGILITTALLCACGSVPDTSPSASIGVATMSEDGTIRLQLRAEGASGVIGDAMLVYPPSDPHYDEVIAHLGGLTPGETKPVPPWPD